MSFYGDAVRGAGVLERDVSFAAVVAWLDSLHSACVEDVVHHRDVEIRELRRGAAQELESVVAMLKDPKKAYEDLRIPTGSE